MGRAGVRRGALWGQAAAWGCGPRVARGTATSQASLVLGTLILSDQGLTLVTSLTFVPSREASSLSKAALGLRAATWERGGGRKRSVSHKGPWPGNRPLLSGWVGARAGGGEGRPGARAAPAAPHKLPALSQLKPVASTTLDDAKVSLKL